jgi:hypothetical protein
MTISAEDRMEIQEMLVYLYTALDQHNGAQYASHFCCDGILENESFGQITGRSAIAVFLNKLCDVGNENGALHCISNVVIWEEEQPQVRLQAEVMKFRVNVTPPEPRVSSFITAQVHKLETVWQIAVLHLSIRP